uniref:Uncharacterized protein n=1 Tax=Romanomermis culicivorax TaxID=13658 RepID=A0A915ICH8_ROMCU
MEMGESKYTGHSLKAMYKDHSNKIHNVVIGEEGATYIVRLYLFYEFRFKAPKRCPNSKELKQQFLPNRSHLFQFINAFRKKLGVDGGMSDELMKVDFSPGSFIHCLLN